MRDVFISYSSLDKKTAEEVCRYMEGEGLECWISCRAGDLQPGQEYMKKIKESIDFSKLFVVLLSRNSVASKQVLQEITLANERQRFGMRIFPIVIDEELEQEDIRRFAGYVLTGKTVGKWKDEEARQELMKQIVSCLGNNATDEMARVQSSVPETGKVIGRDAELENVSELLKRSGRLCVTGMGGIGKTALLQEFCNSEFHRMQGTSKYKTIVYLPIDKCLLHTIANDRSLRLDHDGLAEKKLTLTNYEYALYKLSLLENSADQQMLIVLDNVENGNDPLFDRICSLNCDLIVATRYADSRFSGFERLTVGELKKIESIHELFELYYGEKLKKEEYEYLDKLLTDVRFHTMTVILLAKQMSYFEKRPCDYQNKNQLQYERAKNLAQIMSESMHDVDIAGMYTQLFDLFDASTLSPDEKRVMKTMCVLPLEGVYRHLFVQLIGEEFVPTIVKLEHMGWIQNNNDKSILMLHPLVRDVAMHELEIYLEDPGISAFVSRFIELISNSWNETYQENLKYKELALSIYFQFPKPTLSKYKEYLIMSKLLWVLDCMDIGLEIQSKVKMLFADAEGKRTNSPEEAAAYMQMGITYHGKGDYENAVVELDQAAQIFGDRYAAALSHLAQAYMEVGEKKLEEIEPLLRDSLSIRERYWNGTKSEAASCHLYAKILSAYETKLDYAIQLEKRACNIFSRLEPEGVNVSSAKYILGWLYVQTAEDEDDLEFGIKNLEEAKTLRINLRGELHRWMEDIYLKLGLAYEKCKNDQKAKEYFELLLTVREEKYKNNPSQKQVIESYELLEKVYGRIGDIEAQKKCKKYLRYHA